MDPQRIDKIYRFILNEIAISERQVDFYKSFRMSWTTVVIAGAIGLGSIAISLFLNGKSEMVPLIIQLIFTLACIGLALWTLSSIRIDKTKQMSAILYSLTLKEEFGLLNTKEPVDDPFNVVISEWNIRRNIDRLGPSASKYPSKNDLEVLHNKIHESIQLEQGMSIEEISSRLKALYRKDEKEKKEEDNSGQPTTSTN